MLLLDVSTEFNRYVKEKIAGMPTDSREQLEKFILNHERRDLFLNNVCDQIMRYEHRFKNRITRKGRDQIIEMAAQMFIDNAIKHYADQNISECERLAREREQSEWDEVQETVDEMERLGVEYGEESD